MPAATEEMQCEVVGCVFKTPPMELAMAMQCLELHDKQVHGAPRVVPITSLQAGSKQLAVKFSQIELR